MLFARGVHGYAEFLDIIANPDNPEHGDTKRGAGGHFGPEWFDREMTDKDVRNALRANRRSRMRRPRDRLFFHCSSPVASVAQIGVAQPLRERRWQVPFFPPSVEPEAFGRQHGGAVYPVYGMAIERGWRLRPYARASNTER